MFALALSTIFEVALTAIVVVVLYQVFISDFIRDKIEAFKKRRERKISAANIAHLKLISNNPQDIESWIMSNAGSISEEMTMQLVQRIEYLKAERIVKESFKEDDKKIRVAAQANLKNEVAHNVEEAAILTATVKKHKKVN